MPLTRGSRSPLSGRGRYGPNLLAQDTFDNAVGLSFAGATPGWSVNTTTGVAECTSTAAGSRFIRWSPLVLIPGLEYEVSLDLVIFAGAIAIDVGGPGGDNFTTTGRYTEIRFPGISQFGIVANAAFLGSIDNVTCRRRLPC